MVGDMILCSCLYIYSYPYNLERCVSMLLYCVTRVCFQGPHTILSCHMFPRPLVPGRRRFCACPPNIEGERLEGDEIVIHGRLVGLGEPMSRRYHGRAKVVGRFGGSSVEVSLPSKTRLMASGLGGIVEAGLEGYASSSRGWEPGSTIASFWGCGALRSCRMRSNMSTSGETP